jgi:outer membrane protein TolC
LRLAHVRPLDVAAAAERIRLAAAELQRARVLWLPTLEVGPDYFRHDGQNQDVAGNVFGNSRSTFMFGAGPGMVFAVSDALLAPLAQRQVLLAREAALQAAHNDTMLAVAEAYFNVQQARGELAGAIDSARRAEDLVRRTEQFAREIVPALEAARARAELARRRQAISAARQRWSVASAELARVLRLNPAAVVLPLEPPHLRVTLVPLDCPVDDLIGVALTTRPELAENQALVQATLERLRQERLRPLVPSVLVRGGSTIPTGTLGFGVFGAGRNSHLGDFSARTDIDVQLLWEFQNLGFGNRALVHARKAENRLAVLELFRIQDRVAAEVVQAYAEARFALERLGEAETGVKDALESAVQNFEGLRQTRQPGGAIVLLVRPQEAVAAVQALAQAYNDYYGAVADYDRAQFRLYRALGHPSQFVADMAADAVGCPPPAPPAPPPPEPDTLPAPRRGP